MIFLYLCTYKARTSRKANLKNLLLTILSMIVTLSLQAQGTLPSTYNLTCLNLSSGLPNNYVDDIFQDSKGFIWISTHGGGLVRYDGYSFLDLSVGNQGVPLRSNSCRNVAEDRAARLWITFEEGTQVMSLTTMQPVEPTCTTPQLTSLLKNVLQEQALHVSCDTKGCVWLLTASHLYRIHFDATHTIDGILTLNTRQNSPNLVVKDVLGRGTVLLCTDGIVKEIVPKGNRLLVHNISDLFPPMRGRFVVDMIAYNGKIWLATNAGLVNSGRQAKNEYNCSSTDHSLQHDFVSSLALSPNGKLLVGTLCGVDIIDDRTGQIEHWNSKSAPNPLTSNFVNCLFVKNGQIWVGTETGGITKLSPRQLQLANFCHVDGEAGSISANAVNAMYAQADGTLWVGVVEGGLNRLPPHHTEFSHYNKSNSALPHNSVSVLAPDGSGRLWIGTWGGGVALMPLANPGSIKPLEVDGQHQSLLTFVGAMVFDALNNGMWIGANEGLFFYNLKTRRLEEPFAGCRNIKGCIGSLITRDAKLLMGCLQGMVVVDLKSRRHGRGTFVMTHYPYKLDNPKSHIFDKIISFCQSADGRIWMGSNGYGMYCLTRDKDGKPHFENFTTRQGLVNNTVKGIVEDAHGQLWIATENGLSLFNPKTRLFTNFTHSDGLLSSQFYYNGAVKGPDGWVALGSEEGLTLVRELSGKSKNTSGHLSFTRLTVDNQDIFAGSQYLKEDISVARKISLHESDKSFSIEFSALSYGSETQGTYSYRMKGFDDKWVTLPPGQHSVRYSTLPSGNYEFEVHYSPSTGPSHDETISVRVHVTPYFWKSWWFVTILLICIALLVHYGYKRRLALMREREAEQLYRPLEAALKESDDPAELQGRIQTILDTQRRYRESQNKTVEADKREVEAKTQPFMQRVIEVLEQNYANSEFGVQELSDALAINRSVLSKKLTTETGNPTAKFIRDYRLEVARKMIVDNVAGRNITEIAYRVGFNDPKYFTRCFTRHYGVSPSAYKE